MGALAVVLSESWPPHFPWRGYGFPAFSLNFFSSTRTLAMSGSAAEIGKQLSLITIFPLFGVTVRSQLFGMWRGILPKYQGLQRMSVRKFFTPTKASLTRLSVYGGFMLRSAATAIRASTKPIWLKLPRPNARFGFIFSTISR